MGSFYDDASWLLIPSGIEEDVVFAQKPTSGLGDLTFTRASDATYTDAGGVVRRSPYNLLQFSEMYTDAYWTKSATVTANTNVAPNGTLTADTLTDSNPAAYLEVRSSLITIVANRTHTASYFIKKTTGALTHYAGIAVLLSGGTTRVDYGIINTTNGTVVRDASSNVNSASYSIEDSGDYWRVICTFTDNQSNTSFRLILYPAISVNGTSISDTATGSNVFWGAQLVEGTSALDYFPTTNRQDVPRIDFRNADGTLSSCGRLLLEPQRTNSIRNSSMVGAVAGTPGTLPTNWLVLNASGLSSAIVDKGVENGIEYIDYKITGTANASVNRIIAFEGNTQIGAIPSQAWSNSIYLKIIDNTIPPNFFRIQTLERTSLSFLRENSTDISPTNVLQRFTLTSTMGTSTQFVQPCLAFSVTSSQSYDFTIRIAAPQMELGSYATTWVPTTTAAVTRIADDAIKTGVSSLIGQTEGTIFADIRYEVAQQARMAITDGTTNNWIFFAFPETGTTSRIYIRSSNVVNVDQSFSSLFTANQTYKIALAYKTGNWAFYVNGTQVASGTNSISFNGTFDRIFLNGGSSTIGGVAVYAKYNQAVLFPTRLTNAQLAQLTTL
jgi:hypothetical protein